MQLLSFPSFTYLNSFAFSLLLLDAIESLKQSCESVCPNDGFMEQVMSMEMGVLVHTHYIFGFLSDNLLSSIVAAENV